MTTESNSVTVRIMDRDIKVKCPIDKVAELQEAASFLDKKMHEISSGDKMLNADRIAVIAALNITHELLGMKRQNDVYIDDVSRRIHSLHEKVEQALAEAN